MAVAVPSGEAMRFTKRGFSSRARRNSRSSPSLPGIRSNKGRTTRSLPAAVTSSITRARRTAAVAVIASLLAVAALPARTAYAHAQPYSFLDLRLAPYRLEGNLTAHVFDLAHEIGLGVPNTLLDSATAARHAGELIARLGPRLRLAADGTPLELRWTDVETAREKHGLRFHFWATTGEMPGRLEIQAQLFPYDPQHETYLNVYEAGRLRRQTLLDASKPSVTHYTGGGAGTLAVLRTFVAAGIHHIFLGPDHILLIVGLLLLGGSLARLLKIVTAFTAAHSLTLALATLGIVNPPARLIEPAIALSIVYVGLDNLRVRGGRHDHRALIAFGFGFVHGFGFASVLRDFGLPREALGWSLFAFNLGVELGQTCIVGAVAPLLAWASSRSAGTNRAIVATGSWAVALAGAYWLVQRTWLAGR